MTLFQLTNLQQENHICAEIKPIRDKTREYLRELLQQ